MTTTDADASRSIRELDETPNLLRLYGKAAVGMALPGRGGGDELPELELVLGDVTTDTEELADYDRVCGYRYSDRLPPTFPHILGFPLQMKLMTAERFPFAPTGLVHVANTITQHRAIDVSERFLLRAHAQDLRPHPKGRQFDMVVTAEIGDEVVWEGVSTYLERGRGDDDADTEADDLTAPPESAFTATWKLDGDVGRRYASVSGDPNPIHLHPLTARLFGYPRPIAHGMWTKARALAALEGRLPEAFTVEAAFQKPLLLPADVHFRSEQQDGGWRFAVTPRDGGTPHLKGELTPR